MDTTTYESLHEVLSSKEVWLLEIDRIMDMLDWHNPEDVQQSGREMADKVRCINVFILPLHREHNKNVWDNCAKILASKDDEELRPYVRDMMHWLEDMNWPGAYCILERLNRFERTDDFNWTVTTTVCDASRMPEKFWMRNLFRIKGVKFRFRVTRNGSKSPEKGGL